MTWGSKRVWGLAISLAALGCGAKPSPSPAAPEPGPAAEPVVAPSPSPEEGARAEARSIAKEAYIYATALLENYNTLYKQLGNPEAPEYVGGLNHFRHYSKLFTPANHDVVTPNNDTPYSWAWLDLRAEPIVLSVPKVDKRRYYVLQFIDLFTFNFAYVGVRATGFEAGNYLIVGPQWQGETPAGIAQVLRSETEIAVILGRTSLASASDEAAVRALQSKYQLHPLSTFSKKPAPTPAAKIDWPPYDKAKARSHDFIGYLNFLLQFAEPPHPSERSLFQRFEKIGVAPGKPFDATTLPAPVLSGIDQGIADAEEQLKATIAKTSSANGLFGTREFLAGDYEKRAVGALMGLYGNSREEAWYGGVVGDGKEQVELRFAKEQLPPAKFFWSTTLYELPDRFLFDNALKRYSLGDRTPGLKFEKDGSLVLYVGHESPDKAKESNWLPAPAGPYSLVTRVYGPSQAAIDGTWKLPPLTPVSP
jgi:hypothetical protein